MGLTQKILLTLLVIVGWLTLTTVTIQGGKDRNTLENKVDSLVLELQALNHRMDLLRVHYEHCMFLDKESVEVGYDGYLRVKK